MEIRLDIHSPKGPRLPQFSVECVVEIIDGGVQLLATFMLFGVGRGSAGATGVLEKDDQHHGKGIGQEVILSFLRVSPVALLVY